MIDIGDAVLSVVVQTAEANAQLASFGASVSAQMAPATAAVQQTSTAVSDMGERMATGAQGARQLGDVTTLSGEKAKFSMYEARGEAGLLGEMFGVHLPRHVRSFIAELPGVGTALSSAFAATAVLFIVEAIAKGVEKIVEWREESHKLELAQEGMETAVARGFNALDEKILRAEIRLDELRGNHLEALKKELELINRQTLDQLVHEFDGLAKAVDSVFKQLATHWFSFDAGSKGAQNALEDFKAKYELLLSLGKDKEANDLLSGTLKSAKDTLVTMEEMERKSHEMTTIITPDEHAVQIERGGGPGEKEIKAQRDLVDIFEAQVKSREKIIQLAADDTEVKQAEEAKRMAEEADRAFMAQLRERQKAEQEEDKLEDDRRNKFIADMQGEERVKIAATRQGSEERLKIIDAAIKEEEAHGFQDTAFYRSLQMQRLQAVEARIDQEQKAQLKADSEQLKNAEQESKRELQTVTDSSHAQEKAIDDLEKSKVFSQREGSKRLIAAYEDEKNKALAILNKLLTEEQALMEKASKQLAVAKLNPAITPEQIAQAEQLLNQLKNAVANTETQIAKVTTDAQTRELAKDRTYYGQAVALAVANGNALLAERLKENHAALLSAQLQLADAKARGADTKAIEQQIKALQKSEKELVKEAAAGKKTSQGLMADFSQVSKVIGAYETELDRSASRTAAWGAAVGTVISEVAQAYAQGGISIEQALAKVAAAEINAIAQVAEKRGTEQLARAFGSWPDGAAMAHHFASATLWFSLGAGLSAASGALSGGGGSSKQSSNSAGTAGPAKGSPASTAGSAPTQTINVAHLAAGGLVTKPTFAVVGEAGTEAVVPLRDRAAMQALAGAIGAQMRASGGAGGTITIQLKTDTHQFVKELNHNVKTGRVRLEATNTRKVTRQS